MNRVGKRKEQVGEESTESDERGDVTREGKRIVCQVPGSRTVNKKGAVKIQR